MEEDEVKEALVHCVYSSAATVDFSQQDIIELLNTAKKKNLEIGVTGMLLYDSGSFFKVLEGAPDVVKTLLRKIQCDKRHDRVVKIIFEEIEERSFAQWTMGFSEATREDLKNIEGMNDFFHSNRVFTDLDQGRAKKLLRAFKEGQWRASIG